MKPLQLFVVQIINAAALRWSLILSTSNKNHKLNVLCCVLCKLRYREGWQHTCLHTSNGYCLFYRNTKGTQLFVCSSDGSMAFIEFTREEIGLPLKEDEKVLYIILIITDMIYCYNKWVVGTLGKL